jgi:hypothetical protein
VISGVSARTNEYQCLPHLNVLAVLRVDRFCELRITMADEDEGIVVVEEKVEVTVIPPPTVAPRSSNSTPPWVTIGIVSVLVAILSVVLVWLPSSLPSPATSYQ